MSLILNVPKTHAAARTRRSYLLTTLPRRLTRPHRSIAPVIRVIDPVKDTLEARIHMNTADVAPRDPNITTSKWHSVNGKMTFGKDKKIVRYATGSQANLDLSVLQMP